MLSEVKRERRGGRNSGGWRSGRNYRYSNYSQQENSWEEVGTRNYSLGRRLIKVSHFPRGAPTTAGRCLPSVLLHRVLSNKPALIFQRRKIRQPSPIEDLVTERRTDARHGAANVIPWAKRPETAVDTGVNRDERRHLTIELGRT